MSLFYMAAFCLMSLLGAFMLDGNCYAWCEMAVSLLCFCGAPMCVSRIMDGRWLAVFDAAMPLTRRSLLIVVAALAASMPLTELISYLNRQLFELSLFDSVRAQVEAQDAEYYRILNESISYDGFWPTLRTILGIVVFPALGEEVFYRGFVQRTTMRIASPWVAIAFTAVLFSAAHWHYVEFMPRIFLGAVLGWLCYKRGLWASIVFHACNNLLCLVSLSLGW